MRLSLFYGALALLLALASCSGTATSPASSGDGPGPMGPAGNHGLGTADGGTNATAEAGKGGVGGGTDAGPEASLGAGIRDGVDGQASESGAPAATGPVYPEPGQRTGLGVLPPAVANVAAEGTLVYDNPKIVRDLGYSGVVNGQIVWTFGDTLLSTSNGGSNFCSSDSAALGDLSHPTSVHDKAPGSNGCPQEWIPLTAAEQSGGGLSEYAEGGTNVVEYAPNKGLVWFLKNDRGKNGSGIVGAGVATVTADSSGPRATRMADTMWTSSEPYWGDIGVTYDAQDGNVYVFGHGATALNLKSNVYLARVPATEATNVASYQYWDQSKSAWATERYGTGQNGTVTYTSAQAIFTYASHGQSNAFWSNYYNTWMFVYGGDFGDTDVMVSTAPRLEGPWSKSITVTSTCPNNTCGTLRYAIAPHPEYDPTGKTLLVTWTDSNIIHAVRVEWK